MKTSDSTSLCCCEYYSIEEERSHILGCCCNCQDFDDTVENFLSGQKNPDNRGAAIMATIQDRLRIPWRGGAKQVSPDTLIPVILVPLCLFLAAVDIILTISVLLLIPLFLYYSFYWFKTYRPRTKFFVMWALMSSLIIIIIFEVKVISLLEILPEENLALGILIALFFVCLYRLKNARKQWRQSNDNVETPPLLQTTDSFCTLCQRRVEERMYHCKVCQVCVPERDGHVVWYDCCIGRPNKGIFIFSLLLAIAALLYSSNLTLTTVCHPFTFFQTILLPDDCSEVYAQYDMALCFVSAIYSLLIAIYLIYVLLCHCITISFGLTGNEWRRIPFSTKFYLCSFNRPYNKGFINNWLKIFTTNNKKRIDF